MKGRKWIQMNRNGNLGSGELEGSSLQKAFGDVECPYCNHVFDAGTGEHPDVEEFECPKCDSVRFLVSWLEVK